MQRARFKINFTKQGLITALALFAAVLSLSGCGNAAALSESELLDRMQDACGNPIEVHAFVDMDHDGREELIGICKNTNTYDIWYCSSNGKICRKLNEEYISYDECCIELLPFENETHLVVNAYNHIGTGKEFYIFALQDKTIHTLVSNYGYVYMDEAGDILLDIEAYDGMYDPDIDDTILHTWKDTYLYYDGTAYKQYGAKELSEKEFLKFENAEAILTSIRTEHTPYSLENTERLEFSYFQRSNGILHIQCAQYETDGYIYYYYYTMRYEDNRILADFADCQDGQMGEQFTNIEATY